MVRFLVIAASVSTVSARQRESKECRIGNIQEMKDKYEQFGGLTMTKKKCKKKVTASGNYNHWAFQRRPIYKVTQLGKCYGFNSENFFQNTTSNCVFGKTRQTTQGRICADPKDQKLNDDWKDRDGSNCASYELNNFCNKDGTKGTGWEERWGKIADNKDVNGRSALDACCACGAGSVNKSTTLQPEISTPQTQDKLDELIVEVPCKGRKGWKDSRGKNCDQNECYGYNQAQIDGWANDGCSASEVCDECVAGASSCADPEDQELNDTWFDGDGSNCASYEVYKYCTNDKEPGNGWKTNFGNISEIVGNNGKSPLVSCCACGAGDGIASATRLLKD